MKRAPKDVRRNAEGIPEPTPAEIDAAHAYATDLLREGASSRPMPPIFLACALWNSHCAVRRLQAELAAIGVILAHAAASGLMAEGREDDNEPARPDPRMN